MNYKKLKDLRKKYIPTAAVWLFVAALVSAAVHVVSVLSETFSDFVNRYISSVFRGVSATVSMIVPFSLAETVILLIPVFIVFALYLCGRAANKGTVSSIRFIAGLTSILLTLYSMFVISTVVAYNGTSLASKMGLREEPVSVDELRYAADYVIDRMNEELDNIVFANGNASVMPYSLGEMNSLLMDAYAKAADKYDFIPRLVSRVKPIALSEALTYTHISGIYTYYTGEANINVNFPDYTIPYTAAHELAHQRGFLPEDEANFVAFLVCCEADDPYIRYSGYLNMYQYLNSALYEADTEVFSAVFMSLDQRVKNEMIAYNAFFEKYRDNKAADISSVINDNYLKFQGESAGEKSYGMVVDLAVAYVASLSKD